MKHELKINQSYFEAVICGDKTFEIRFNDRGFQKGDRVCLNEISLKTGLKTSRSATATISYVTNFNQSQDWVVFGIKDVESIVK